MFYVLTLAKTLAIFLMRMNGHFKDILCVLTLAKTLAIFLMRINGLDFSQKKYINRKYIKFY